MAQLVGQTCVLCGERIGWIGDSRFCRECRRPVHNACAKPGEEAVTGSEPTCPGCGAPGRVAPPPPKDKREAVVPHEIGVLTRVGGGLALAVGACLIGLVVYIWMLRGYNPYTLKGRVTVTIIGVVLVYAGCQWVRGQAAFTRRGDHEGRPREPQAPTE